MLYIEIFIISFIGYLLEFLNVNYFTEVDKKYNLLLQVSVFLLYFHNTSLIYNDNINPIYKFLYLIIFCCFAEYSYLSIKINNYKVSDFSRIMFVTTHSILIPLILKNIFYKLKNIKKNRTKMI